MTEIPDDIHIKSENVLDAILCECEESCGGTAGLRTHAIDVIAAALTAERQSATAAERKRCAKIAEEHEAKAKSEWKAPKKPKYNQFPLGYEYGSRAIAAAIREATP